MKKLLIIFGLLFLFASNSFARDLQTKATTNEVNYKEYIESLSTKNINSISQAVSKYKTLALKDKQVNDNMFRTFRNYYKKVIKDNDITNEEESTYNHSNDKSKKSIIYYKIITLKNNGVSFWHGEEGTFGTKENYDFLLKTFGNYVSDGLKKFITINKDNDEELFCSSASMQYLPHKENSYDILSDRIVVWEDYVKKFAKYPEVKEAQDNINSNFEEYIGIINQAKLEEENYRKYETWEVKDIFKVKADTGLVKSYERFIKKYPKSNYLVHVKGTYEVLKKNNNYISNNTMAQISKIIKKAKNISNEKVLKIGWEFHNYPDKNNKDPYSDVYLVLKGNKDEKYKIRSNIGAFHNSVDLSKGLFNIPTGAILA